MGMGVDETGEEHAVGEARDAGVARGGDLGVVTDGSNASIVFHQHGSVRDRRSLNGQHPLRGEPQRPHVNDWGVETPAAPWEWDPRRPWLHAQVGPVESGVTRVARPAVWSLGAPRYL